VHHLCQQAKKAAKAAKNAVTQTVIEPTTEMSVRYSPSSPVSSLPITVEPSTEPTDIAVVTDDGKKEKRTEKEKKSSKRERKDKDAEVDKKEKKRRKKDKV
jgi:hypothetical protein